MKQKINLREMIKQVIKETKEDKIIVDGKFKTILGLNTKQIYKIIESTIKQTKYKLEHRNNNPYQDWEQHTIHQYPCSYVFIFSLESPDQENVHTKYFVKVSIKNENAAILRCEIYGMPGVEQQEISSSVINKNNVRNIISIYVRDMINKNPPGTKVGLSKSLPAY